MPENKHTIGKQATLLQGGSVPPSARIDHLTGEFVGAGVLDSPVPRKRQTLFAERDVREAVPYDCIIFHRKAGLTDRLKHHLLIRGFSVRHRM